jgi:hypothetical protein
VFGDLLSLLGALADKLSYQPDHLSFASCGMIDRSTLACLMTLARGHRHFLEERPFIRY